jgi:hypothetical protein
MPHDVSTRTRVLAGCLAIVFYIIHAAYTISVGETPAVLWVCHVSALVVAAGWFLERPRLFAVPLLWLAWGNLLWALYLAGGGDFYPTSIFTHIGAMVLAILGLRIYGMPRRSWPWATAGMGALVLITRITTPPQLNVNLAHRVHEGWETMFPSHLAYVLLLLCAASLVFIATEAIARKLLGKKKEA